MIFETLHDSSQKGELMLVGGGMCHWHLRRDGQLTIREIISTRPGAGALMLRRLESVKGATSLFAKCPADLPANAWYTRRGFHVEKAEWTNNGRMLLCWRKSLKQRMRRPNVGNLEVIYCADGNPRAARVAIDAGMLYGAQLPNGTGFRPYFADQNWKTPNRERYMTALAEQHPQLATVLDWERPEQLDEVLSWAEEAARYVQTVVIIPKVHGGIQQLPRNVGGKPVRLGYSIPTKFAGTTVPLHEFEGWPVHLLGGSPEKQMELYRVLNVWSVDCNYIQKMAFDYAQYWANTGVGRVRWWPKLSETDGFIGEDGCYEAFRRSCVNVMHAWRETVSTPHLGLPDERQLSLPMEMTM
jgi:hypothetical protein